MKNDKDPFQAGGAENISKADIAPYTRTCFKLNHAAPTFEVAQRSSGQSYGGWRVENEARRSFISFKRTQPRKHEESVGDKFHISVSKADVPKAFEILSKLINAENSPINAWKTTDVTRTDPRDTRLSQGAQFTLYPKPDRADGTYSPEFLGKTQALVNTIEQELKCAGIRKSDHKPASDVSAPQWGYVSYRNEHRSNRVGSESQSAALRDEPFFKLTSGT